MEIPKLCNDCVGCFICSAVVSWGSESCRDFHNAAEDSQNSVQQLKDSISDLKKLIPFIDRNGCLQNGCGFDIKLNAVIAKLESICRTLFSIF